MRRFITIRVMVAERLITPEGWTAVSKALARLFGYLPPPGKINGTNAKMVKIKNLS
jgi:hypothetical protein